MGVGALILAAGAATRMGRTKQLLPYRGQTLVEHAIIQAQYANFAPVVAVLGAQADTVAEAIAHSGATVVVNQNWESGMGSSLTTGVGKILAIAPALAAIAVLLADQPYVTAQHLSNMRTAFEKGSAPILAASYAGTIGVPAIFGRSVFERLRRLAPDAGARALLRGGETEVRSYELPEAATDIDTPEDFSALR